MSAQQNGRNKTNNEFAIEKGNTTKYKTHQALTLSLHHEYKTNQKLEHRKHKKHAEFVSHKIIALHAK